MSAQVVKSTAKTVVVSVQDFAFMGGSMGMAVGEAFMSTLSKAAIRDEMPVYHLHRRRWRTYAGGHIEPDADAGVQHRRHPDACMMPDCPTSLC